MSTEHFVEHLQENATNLLERTSKTMMQSTLPTQSGRKSEKLLTGQVNDQTLTQLLQLLQGRDMQSSLFYFNFLSDIFVPILLLT